MKERSVNTTSRAKFPEIHVHVHMTLYYCLNTRIIAMSEAIIQGPPVVLNTIGGHIRELCVQHVGVGGGVDDADCRECVVGAVVEVILAALAVGVQC